MTTHPLQPDVLASARVVVLGRPGCHLCDVVHEVVERVVAETGDTWARVVVDEHPVLLERYAEEIPVTFVDGRQHDYWRVDETRLRRVLATRPPGPDGPAPGRQ